jgi:melibiase-like protein
MHTCCKRAANLKIGSLKFHFETVSGNSQIFNQVQPDFNCSEIANIKEKACYISDEEQVQVLYFDNALGFAYRRIISNVSENQQKIKTVRDFLDIAEGSPFYPDKNLLCFHAENTRLYEVFTTPVLADRTLEIDNSFQEFEPISGTSWAGPGNYRTDIGRSPFQSFPAIIYTRRDSDAILLDGSLTQNRFYRYYGILEDQLVWSQRAKTVKDLLMDPGEQFIGEWNYVETGTSKGLNHPYDSYLQVLHNFGVKYRGVETTNRDTLIWGSWNHGIHRNIHQDDLLKNADYVKKHFPTVKWYQIDDGYDAYDYSIANNRVALGIFHEGEAVSKEKFPDGIESFVKEIKKRGLRPALWTGLTVSTARRPYLDNPDWFIVCYQTPQFAIYDISKLEVRKFISEAFRKIIKEWGFEGIKLDFWSYFFEDEQVIIPAGKITGGDYRRWLLGVIRSLLPEDGYLQLGCDIAMANPHLGEFADNYRYGIDIGSGNWNNFCTNAKWAAFCINTHSGNFMVPNSDSIGFYPGLSKKEAETSINFCLVTRSLVEISGWLYKEPNNQLMPFLIKAACCPKNGEKVYFGNFNFKNTDAAPEIWYTRSPHFSYDENNSCLSVRTVGIFNWDDKEDIIELSAECLGLNSSESYMLKDFWSDEIIILPAHAGIKINIDAHHSHLYSVCREVSPVILDSNTQLNNVRINKDILKAEMPFIEEAELFLNFIPKKIIIGNNEATFKTEKIENYHKIKIRILK